MTPLEKQVYLTTFCANQPQPGRHGNAAYWAAAAVFVLRRSDTRPTNDEVEELFNEFLDESE